MASQGNTDPADLGYEEWTVKARLEAMVSAGLTDEAIAKVLLSLNSGISHLPRTLHFPKKPSRAFSVDTCALPSPQTPATT